MRKLLQGREDEMRRQVADLEVHVDLAEILLRLRGVERRIALALLVEEDRRGHGYGQVGPGRRVGRGCRAAAPQRTLAGQRGSSADSFGLT